MQFHLSNKYHGQEVIPFHPRRVKEKLKYEVVNEIKFIFSFNLAGDIVSAQLQYLQLKL